MCLGICNKNNQVPSGEKDIFSAVHETEEFNILSDFLEFGINHPASFTTTFYNDVNTLLSFYNLWGERLSQSCQINDSLHAFFPYFSSMYHFLIFPGTSYHSFYPPQSMDPCMCFHVPNIQIKGTCPNYSSCITFPK